MSWQGDGSQSGRRRNMAIKSTMNRLNAGDKNDNSQILYFCKNDAWEIRFLLLPHRHCQRLALGVCCDRFQLTNIVDRIYFSLSFTVFFLFLPFLIFFVVLCVTGIRWPTHRIRLHPPRWIIFYSLWKRGRKITSNVCPSFKEPGVL